MERKLSSNKGGTDSLNYVYDPSEVEETLHENQSEVVTGKNSNESTVGLNEDKNRPKEGEIIFDSEKTQTSKNNEEDLCIIYENISPLSEVQIVNSVVHQPIPKSKRKVNGRKRPFLGDSGSRDISVVNTTESSNINSLDDSVSIISEVAAPILNESTEDSITEDADTTNESSNINSLDDSVCIVGEVSAPILNQSKIMTALNLVKKSITNILPTEVSKDGSTAIVKRKIFTRKPSVNYLDESVYIVGEYDAPRFPQTPPLNPNKNNQSIGESVTQKKPRIECSVCFDGTEEILSSGRLCTTTICGHFFCNECIKTAIKVNKNCPKCRKRLTNKQYHPVYL